MRKNLPFSCADILLPNTDLSRFAVIACDQFTSQADYWQDVERTVGDAPSALRITFPEIYLNDNPEARIAAINETMDRYLQMGLFTEHKDVLIYVERTLPDGSVRHGLVGKVDLEAYSFKKGDKSLIRATEGTVLSRIPPRVAIRRDAPLELPHVMLFIDDPEKTVIEPLSDTALPLAYDFELMAGGGHLRGKLVTGEAAARVLASLAALAEGQEDPLLFAVGDGNHSLATAKTCYEQAPNEKNRYALVEVVNIHDEAIHFEPIYRVLFGVDASDLFAEFTAYAASLNGNGAPQEILCCFGGKEVTVCVEHPVEALPVGTLQTFLDAYLSAHPEAEIDYIHGIDVTKELSAREHAMGFLFCGMEKAELFGAVCADGALPRKTFSMGEAQSKRYYLEARSIR